MLIFEQFQKSDRHLRMLAVVVSLGLAALVGGLWYVQVVAGKRFAEDQMAQSFRTVRIPAVRGKIMDREGRALAENRPCYNASVYLEELSKLYRAAYHVMVSNEAARVRQAFNRKLTREERAYTAQQARYSVTSNVVQRLGLLLGQPLALDPGVFGDHYSQRLALPLPALANLNSNQVARLMEQAGLPPGIDLDVQPMRHYPHGETAAHLLGYLRKDNSSREGEDAFFNYRLPDFKGVIGLEGVFDEQLRGRAGVKSVLVNSLGYRQSENIWTAAEPGQNVVLTLDLYIQQAAEHALRNAERDSGMATRGAVVVMDPNNGDLLALASTPAFDPGLFVPSISAPEMAKLNDEVLRPTINRASQERYAPGSIFKIITALAALEAGVLNPNEIITCHGAATVGQQQIKDTAPPGEYNFKRAFKLSSNEYFIHFGLKAGLDNLLRMGQRFHLGEPLELPTGQSDGGIFPNREMIRRLLARGDPWTDGDTANLCIGQGYLAVNPVQMAVMTAAVVNGGKVYWPRLVQRIEPLEASSLHEPGQAYPPRLRGELGINPRHLELVREAMLADVEDSDGTGRRAAVPNLQIGGKTGTAEVKLSVRQVDKIVWFTSFAPYDKPQYVIVVMVESGASGGLTCAPVAGQIYRAIRQRSQIPAGQTVASYWSSAQRIHQ
jgi:penicillin-binding protein 2